MIEPEKKEETAKLPDVDRVLIVAGQLHELFLEYRDQHGCAEETAWAKAVCEFLDAKNGETSRADR